MSTPEPLDPAAADEIVAKVPPVEGDFLEHVFGESAVPPAPGRLHRGLLSFALFLLGLAAGFGAGFAYGYGLVEGENRIDLFPPYADWPPLWWVALASVPVALVLAFWKRVRAFCFGYLLALPWQLVISLVYSYVTFGTWGYTPQP